MQSVSLQGHIDPFKDSLHWLSVSYGIHLKLANSYILDLINISTPSRTLGSTKKLQLVIFAAVVAKQDDPSNVKMAPYYQNSPQILF